LRGEIAFEIASTPPGNITDIYILKGDGLLPTYGDYRRLRITYTRKEIKDQLDAIIAALNQERVERVQNDEAIRQRIGTQAIPFGAANVIAALVAETGRAEAAEAGGLRPGSTLIIRFKAT
jgi:hypothetical protein